MRRLSIIRLSILAVGALAFGTGCAGATIQPGHRALYFDPSNGGIQHEVLQPGWYSTTCPFWTPDNKCPRVDDFDVTYSTSKEQFHTLTSEGLPIDLRIAVAYRPIVAELYLLDTEIGPHYFDEVIGPEFRSAAIGIFAKTSYQDLQKKNGVIEDEIEKALRERLKGKHIEVSSVLIEKVTYAPEIMASQKDRVVSQEETLRREQILENEAAQKTRELKLTAETKKLELATQTEQTRMELQAQAEQEKFRIESLLRNKEAEEKLTLEQARIDKMKAQATAATEVTAANGEATARLALAKATAEEKRAEAASITPMQVEMHAYDALGQLGGTGTTIMLGDWSKLPNWLFPKVPGFQTAFSPMYMWPPTPGLPTPTPPARPTMTRTGGNPYP